MHHVVVDKVDDDFWNRQYVFQRVFGRVVFHPAGRAENDDRWLGRKHIEVTERCEVVAAFFVYRTGKGDGTRGDATEEFPVQIAPCEFRRVE